MKSILTIILTLATMLLMQGVSSATPVQWTVASGGNGHWYDVVQYKSTWGAANMDAQARTYDGMTGYLATLTSAAENEFVWSNFSFLGYWLGGYQTSKDNEPSGNWAWVTGETWSYTNWTSGEPNNVGGNEDHLQFDWYVYGGTWNDMDNSATSGPMTTQSYTGGYIIEYSPSSAVPIPSAIILLGSSLAGFITYRKKSIA